MKMLLIAIGCAVITTSVITYAQHANSEQEEFNARIEQQILDNYEGDYTVEKAGNVVRLTQTYAAQSAWGYHEDLAIAPLRARFLALIVLDMDGTQKELNSNHKLAAFIKVLICQPDATVIGQAIVFRKDYADQWAIKAARNAAYQELQEETKRWIRAMQHR